jgi:hypothetical protein
MTHRSIRPKLFLASALLAPIACVALAAAPAMTSLTRPSPTPLDQLIPQDKWNATGLTKLTATEQQTLATEITTLLGARQSQSTETPNATPTFKDRTQWRKLQRHMSKDDVKKLLGDPFRVSVSHYYESWDYLGGTVTFDSKGHLDFWSES